MASERLIPLAAMEQLIKKHSDLRVGEDAKAELKFLLEQYAKKIAVKAAELAKHAGRRTIQGNDIKLAEKE